jgi:hypothetical protein
VLPETGIITVADLATFTETTPISLIESLDKYNIPILKLSKKHTSWLVKIADLKIMER